MPREPLLLGFGGCEAKGQAGTLSRNHIGIRSNAGGSFTLPTDGPPLKAEARREAKLGRAEGAHVGEAKKQSSAQRSAALRGAAKLSGAVDLFRLRRQP